MDTAKLIRTIGYIVYTCLWLPIILACMVFMPILVMVTCIKEELPVISGLKWFGESLKEGIAHDMNFIKTGEW